MQKINKTIISSKVNGGGWKKLLSKLKQAFTLVELIVIIVIITILTTVAFLNFRNYPKEARNAVRKADIKNIKNSMERYYIENGSYPYPDNVNKTGSWWIEWDLWSWVTKKLTLSEILDPSSKKPYSYDLLVTGNTYRVEAKDSEWEYIGHWKYNTDWIYINEVTWYIFEMKNNTWKNEDKNCPLPDIDVYNWSWELLQTWAWCNSTLWNWVERKNKNTTSIKCNNYKTTSTFIPWWCGEEDYIKSRDNPRKFFDKYVSWWKNTNWDTEFDTIWWKLYRYIDAPSACPKWRYLPKKDELELLLKSLWCNNSSFEQGQYKCHGFWWKWKDKRMITNNLIELLKVPLTGFFQQSVSIFKWWETYLFLKEPYHYIAINVNRENIYYGVANNEYAKTHSHYPVRCIKHH